MEVCYWALLFMPLVILHHLLNVSVQLANKRGFKQKQNRDFFFTKTNMTVVPHPPYFSLILVWHRTERPPF
jgi:hypothetical protein